MTDDSLAHRLATAAGTWRRREKVARSLASAQDDLRAASGRSGDTATTRALRADVTELQLELGSLGNAEALAAEYASAFAAMEQSLAQGPLREEILAASCRHADLVADRREVDEAIAAGEAAARALDEVTSEYQWARGSGRFRSINRTFAKWWRSGLSDAARYADDASVCLDRFRRELQDVRLSIPGPPEQLDLSHVRPLGPMVNDITDAFTLVLGRKEEAANVAADRVADLLVALREERRRVVAELEDAAERRRALVEGGHS